MEPIPHKTSWKERREKGEGENDGDFGQMLMYLAVFHARINLGVGLLKSPITPHIHVTHTAEAIVQYFSAGETHFLFGFQKYDWIC